MDAAPAVGLQQGGVAEPDPAPTLGLFGKHPHPATPDEQPHVPPDAGGAGRRDAGAAAVKAFSGLLFLFHTLY